jgi:hypothetical protein
MILKVEDILEIINIINHSFEKLLFFKFVIQIKAFDPFRVQTVHYNFSVSNKIPILSFFLIEKHNSISSSERV